MHLKAIHCSLAVFSLFVMQRDVCIYVSRKKKTTLFWKKVYMAFTETSPRELHKVLLHNMLSQGNSTSVL